MPFATRSLLDEEASAGEKAKNRWLLFETRGSIARTLGQSSERENGSRASAYRDQGTLGKKDPEELGCRVMRSGCCASRPRSLEIFTSAPAWGLGAFAFAGLQDLTPSFDPVLRVLRAVSQRRSVVIDTPSTLAASPMPTNLSI